jgi:hypothetical protein
MRQLIRHVTLIPVLGLIALWSCDDAVSPAVPPQVSDAGTALRTTAGQELEFTQHFRLDECAFATRGRNPYFVLEPGYTLVFEDGEGGRLTVTVLDRIERVGGIATRVVEEREVEDDELVEVSRNYFAICTQNNSVFYFGEAVDNYENGKVVNHDGSWRHGSKRARAGLIMPGIALLGARYYQEIAPDVALDRAEIVALDARVRTPFRSFDDVLVTRESTPLEPGVVELKWYAPGIGLIKDADLELVAVRSNGRDDD